MGDNFGIDLFTETEAVIQKLEEEVVATGIQSANVNQIYHQWRLSVEGQAFTEEEQAAVAVELLRVWMELQFEAGSVVSVYDAVALLSGGNISSDGRSLLQFEYERLLKASRQTEQSQRLQAEYPEVGTSWQGFHLLATLGKGAIARVFLAQQNAMSGRLVVLKITTRQTSESVLLARIQHSGVVPIYSIHEENGLYGVCMPYVGSTTLADLLVGGCQDELFEADRELLRARGQRELTSRLVKLFPKKGNLNATIVSGKTIISHLKTRQSMVLSWVQSDSPAEPKIVVDNEPHRDQAEVSSSDSVEPLHHNQPSRYGNEDSRSKTHTESFLPDITSSLSETFRRLEKFNYIDTILWFGTQLADALHHVHCCGVVHCDVKPANILLGYDGQVRLLDFNVSQQDQRYQQETGFDQLAGGTPAYMAPEQRRALLADETYVPTSSVDTYALGAVLFEMLTGEKPPPQDVTQQDKLQLIFASCPRRLTRDIQAVLIKSMAFDPDARYESASDLGDDLRAILGSEPLVHQREPSHREAFIKWRRRHPRITSGGSVAMLAASVVLVVSLWGWFQNHEQRLANHQLAMSQLHRELPETLSLLSATKEFGELQNELHQSLKRVAVNLQKIDPEFNVEAGDHQMDPASIVLGLSRIQKIWFTHVGRTGGVLSPLYRVSSDDQKDSVSIAEFQNMAEKFGGKISKTTGVTGDFDDLFTRGKFTEAIECAELNPDFFRDYSNLLLLGHCYLLTGEYQIASNRYSEAVSFERSFPLAKFYRGVALISGGDYQRAELDFREVLKDEPDFKSAWFNLGLAFFYQAAWEDSERAFTEVIEADKDATKAWLLRARARSQMNDLVGTQSDIEAAMKTKPQQCQDLLELCHLMATKDLDQAIRLARRATEAYPDNIDARQSLSHVLSQVDDGQEESILQLDHILRIDASNHLALGGRAVMQARLGRYRLALDDLERLENLQPANPLIMYQIACGFSLIANPPEVSDEHDSLGSVHSKTLSATSTSMAKESRSLSMRNAVIDRETTTQELLDRAMHWYRKAFFADQSVYGIASSDEDLETLRNTETFRSFHRFMIGESY